MDTIVARSPHHCKDSYTIKPKKQLRPTQACPLTRLSATLLTSYITLWQKSKCPLPHNKLKSCAERKGNSLAVETPDLCVHRPVEVIRHRAKAKAQAGVKVNPELHAERRV